MVEISITLGRSENCFFVGFFSIRIFVHGYWWLTGQQGKGGDHFLFHFTTSTRSGTFRHLFATLHVRWPSHITNDYHIVMDDYHIFACEMSVTNRTTCIYQTATRWDFTPYRINVWFTDDAMLIFVRLLDDLILGVRYSNFTQETGGLELTSTITLVL